MSTSTGFTLLLTALFPVCALSAEFRLHPSGFGPVRIGMSVNNASRLLGTPLIKLSATYQDDRCVVYPKSKFNGLSFGVTPDGSVDSVYVGYTGRRFKTDKGLHVGSTANDLRRLYGNRIELKTYQCADLLHEYIYRQPGHSNQGFHYTVNAKGKIEGIMSGNLGAVIPPC